MAFDWLNCQRRGEAAAATFKGADRRPVHEHALDGDEDRLVPHAHLRPRMQVRGIFGGVCGTKAAGVVGHLPVDSRVSR